MSSRVPQHRRAIASRAISGDLAIAIEAAASAGFAAVELWADDVIASFGAAGPCLQALERAGIGIASLQLLRDVEGIDEAEVAAAHAKAERVFGLAQDLGSPPVLVCSAIAPDAINDASLSASQLARLADRAGQRGLQLHFEGLSISRHIRSWKQAQEVVLRADRTNLTLCLDSAHMALMGDQVPEAADLSSIGFVQLADLPSLEGDQLTLNRHQRLFPQEGVVDCAALISRLHSLGYRGLYSLEVFSDRNHTLDPFDVARRGYASFDYPTKTSGE